MNTNDRIGSAWIFFSALSAHTEITIDNLVLECKLISSQLFKAAGLVINCVDPKVWKRNLADGNNDVAVEVSSLVSLSTCVHACGFLPFSVCYYLAPLPLFSKLFAY